MNSIKDLNQLSQPEFANLLGCSTRTIQRNPKLEKLRHGSGQGCYYVWSEFWETLNPNLSQLGEVLAPTDRARREKAEADMAEMEAAKMGGDLVDAQDVARTWQAFLGRLRQNLLGLADRVGPRLDDGMVMAERIDIIRREVYQSLRDVVVELGVAE